MGKYCIFCAEWGAYLISDNNSESGMFISGNVLINKDSDSDCIPINFCPMCGEQLRTTLIPIDNPGC